MHLFYFFMACGEEVSPKSEPSQEGTIIQDMDGDGFNAEEDCNDNDATINSSLEEICDGIDNNCDGNIDEGVLTIYYADSDNDGFGSSQISIEACESTDGFVSNGSDCDDTEPSAFPGGEEICDNIDNDCNGQTDDGIGILLYVDLDGDGFGDANNTTEACGVQDGLSTLSDDCDDSNENINPLSTELCDSIDNNCDGNVDENVKNTYFADLDEDGFGDPENTIEGCEQPPDYTTDNSDCDDIDSLIFPNAAEYCDEKDNNCNGDIDEDSAVNTLTWYEDGDEDTFGDPNNAVQSCTQPIGFVSNQDDCNDNQQTVNPSAAEICDTEDNNCNGENNELGAEGGDIYYKDGDADGFGDLNSTMMACEQPDEYVSDSTDCNDNNEDINPNASEVCNEKDDNCVDGIDEDTATDAQDFYQDEDGDGYGTPDNTITKCLILDGYVINSDDCNDSNPDANAYMMELCSTDFDDNCDGEINEGTASDALLWYEDGDNDTYGDENSTMMACEQPNQYVEDNTDCDDNNNTISPDGDDICNGQNDDCANGIDDGPNVQKYYADTDLDGFGDPESNIVSCDPIDGHVLDNTDCDDNDINLGTTLYDADCDGLLSINDCDDNSTEQSLYAISEDCAGVSCEEIRDTNTSAGLTPTDGVYWINPEGTAMQVYCDMTTDEGGWTVLQHDQASGMMTGAYGIIGDQSGWSLDYSTTDAFWATRDVKDFYIEIEDGPQGILKGLVQYGTTERPTSYGLFNSNGGQSWQCDSDSPSSSCHFTDEEGRHWGQWSHTSGCCIGTKGWWYFSHNNSSTHNYGICQDGYPNGDLVFGNSSVTGCTGGYYTSFSTGSKIFRIAIRYE